MAVALLVVNNLRDIPGDTVAGKRTLAVRLGAARPPALTVLAPRRLCASSSPWRPGGRGPCSALRLPCGGAAGAGGSSGAKGPALIPVLGATGRAQLVLGVLLAVGLAL